MKEKSMFSSLGILLYIILSIIDRFIFAISDIIYLTVAFIGIILIVIGDVIDKKKNR